MKKKIILDTDIGTDVDDALALTMALNSREDIELRAVTTVHGDVNLRARIALKILKLAGREDIPVAAGISHPLIRDRPILGWKGYEGDGFLTSKDEALKPSKIHAVDLIISEIMSMKNEITFIAIGPLTNIAAAIIKELRIIENVREVIVMGGSVRLFNGLNLPLIEHNIKCDPEAARVVFSSGMPITMVPLDVTLKVTIERREIDLIRAAKTSLTDAIAMMITRYLDIVKRDYTWLHDPLALAVSIDNSLVKTIDAKILVETKGEYTTGQTIALPIEFNEKPVKVYIDVDIKRFKKFFMKRICLCV